LRFNEMLSKVLCLVALSVAHAFRPTGSAHSDEGWRFIAKFCFDRTSDDLVPAGIFQTVFTDPPDPNQNLWYALYDDQEGSWDSVYHSGLSCYDKTLRAKNLGDIMAGSAKIKYGVPTSVSIYETHRPRFWYAVMLSCWGLNNQTTYFGSTHYDLHFTQAQGTSWDIEFGVNEMGLNSLYLVAFLVYLIFTTLHMYFAIYKRYKSENKFVHGLVKIYTGSLALQFFTVFFELIHYGTYGRDGQGVPGLDKFARVLDAFARVTFILLLLLLAQGWTINRPDLRFRFIILAAIGILTAFYVSLIIWDAAGRDPASTLYVYDSVPGYLVITEVCILWLWFLVTVILSIRSETDKAKRCLFLTLAILYSLWFLVLPFIVLVALALSPWVREKVVTGFLVTAGMIGYCVLGSMLWSDAFFAIKTPDVNQHSTYDQL